MFREEGNYAQAIAEYDRLTRAAPRFAVGYIGEAEAQIMLGKTADAYQTLENWKRSDPASALPYQVIANLHLVDREPQKAVLELRSGLAKYPNSSTLLSLLGTAYARVGDAKSAKSQYEAALTADARNVDAMIGLGDIAAKGGKPEEAIGHYRKALKIEPANAIASNNLAWILAEQGKSLDEARILAQAATKAGGDSYVDAYDTLGWVYYQRGEYSQAVISLSKAKSLAPRRLDIAGHLGLAYAKAGRKKEAVVELKRALSGTASLPNRTELERVLAELSKTSRS